METISSLILSLCPFVFVSRVLSVRYWSSLNLCHRSGNISDVRACKLLGGRQSSRDSNASWHISIITISETSPILSNYCWMYPEPSLVFMFWVNRNTLTCCFSKTCLTYIDDACVSSSWHQRGRIFLVPTLEYRFASERSTFAMNITESFVYTFKHSSINNWPVISDSKIVISFCTHYLRLFVDETDAVIFNGNGYFDYGMGSSATVEQFSSYLRWCNIDGIELIFSEMVNNILYRKFLPQLAGPSMMNNLLTSLASLRTVWIWVSNAVSMHHWFWQSPSLYGVHRSDPNGH